MHGGRIGVLVEIGCETDFVAGTDEFKAFAHEVALQISASSDARWVSREDVPPEIVEAELEIYRAQAADKPENVRDRIVAGQARQVALHGLPARAAVRARQRPHDRRPAHRDRRQDGRERADQALHALRARRLRAWVATGPPIAFDTAEVSEPAPSVDGRGPFHRVLIKLSGEALLRPAPYGQDPGHASPRSPPSSRPCGRAASRSRSWSAPATSGGACRRARTAWTGRPRTTAACSRPCSTRWRCRTRSSAGARRRACSRRSTVAEVASRTSAGAPCATSRRTASSCSRPAPATRSSRPTPARPCARARSAPRRS